MKIPKYFYFRVRVINKGTSIEVEDASDVDVVEVVRCKDCRYWRDDDCKNDNHGYCPINENDFCSRGVRKKKQ